MRVDELVGFFQIYEMTFLNSQKRKDSTFKDNEIEEKEFENHNEITRDELAFMAKRIKWV